MLYNKEDVVSHTHERGRLVSYEIEHWLDEDDAPKRPRRSFDFQCMMGRVPVATPLTLKLVRRARATYQPLAVTLPNARMVGDGFYKGIVSNGPSSIDVTLRFGFQDGEFHDDRFPGIGRVFPIAYDGENEEHPKLQFLVFDPERSEWYLSCGGMRHCYWCQTDREVEEEMRREPSFLGSSLGSGYDDDDW
jgi:hypothetical protein